MLPYRSALSPASIPRAMGRPTAENWPCNCLLRVKSAVPSVGVTLPKVSRGPEVLRLSTRPSNRGHVRQKASNIPV